LGTDLSVKYNNTKIAVIGCGNWGKNLARVLSELGALYGVCDTEPSKALAFAEKYGVSVLSLDEILSNPEIDGVFISTPSTTHYELAYICLEANKHVFIEKPLALRIKNALSLQKLAEQQKRIFMVGHLLQYHSGFRALKRLKNEGLLGDLHYIYSNRFSFGKFRTEENVLWDFAPHDVSMILALANDVPTQIIATAGNHLMHTVADTAHLHLHFNNNVKGHIFVSWLHPYKEQKLVVCGTKAMAIFDDCQPWENKLRLHRYPEEWVDGLPRPFPSHFENIPLEPSEPLTNECEHFLNCIQHHTQPYTDANEGIRVMAVLEAAMQSIETHSYVQLPALGTAGFASKHVDTQREIELEEVS
jgi:predicted dehydrogenase